MSQAEDIRKAIRFSFPPNTIVTYKDILTAVQGLYPNIPTGSIMPADQCFGRHGQSRTTGCYPALQWIDSGQYKTLPAWESYQFPKPLSSVYIICMHFVPAEKIPFYIGQTQSFRRRMGDYSLASFQAQTDFAVGSAIRYLEDAQIAITVFHMDTDAVDAKEKYLIAQSKTLGIDLLNSISRYNYKSASRDDEYKKVSTFIEAIRNKALTDAHYVKNCNKFARKFGF